jgi:transcriptional regulator with PAS, ATPase and Fis domain
MLASELFGHVKGAFTDAIRERVGRFDLANTGTIFLDEIAEMPLQMQVQLLRVLQEGTFERLGESTTRRVNVRVIAATNRNIGKELAAGNFRDDLYYRLNVIPIHLPALRERRSDIPHLVQHFINKFSLLSSKNIAEIDDDAMDLLCSYDWPGNVRELENAIEYSFARTKESILRASKLPPSIKNAMPAQSARYFEFETDPEHLGQDIKHLKTILEKNKWNRSKVAKELRIGRTTLWRKMKVLGLLNPES